MESAVDRCVPISHANVQFESVLVCIEPCHGNCVCGCVGCRHEAIVAFLLYRQSNCPGAGAEIQHTRAWDETLQREFDQQFGFRSWNQYSRRNVQFEIPEFAPSGDVCDWRSFVITA